jgi:ankyrin repeat protein
MTAIEKACDAIRRGDSQMMKKLIDADTSLARSRDENGVSLLMLACYHRESGCIDVLLAGGGKVDIFEAASLGRSLRVEDLWRERPDVIHDWSSDGFQPLHLAAFFGRSETLSLLLDHGADPNVAAKNPMSVRPLHSAAASRSRDAVRILIEHGAEVNVQQHGGWTPLHAVAMHGDMELTQYFLDHGADPHIKSDDGKTARDLAEANGHLQIAELLRQSHAHIAQ